jgi:dihydroorotase
MKIGLRGIPAHSEEIMVSRDIMLAGTYRGHLHIAHVSTGKARLNLYDRLKKRFKSYCRNLSYYFTLTDDSLKFQYKL